MKTLPEVCNENMTLPENLEPSILSTLKLQTKFQAGQLRNFLPQWKTVTTDPKQFSAQRPSVFNTKQHAEIDKLLAKGVIIPAAQDMGEFISTIFLRPKKMARTAPFSISKSLTNS